MDIAGRSFLVIGGAGFIGSHVVDALLAAGAAQVRVYDNFSRGTSANLAAALRDPRCDVVEGGADILHRDVLARAMRGSDGVFLLAALWLLHCHEYPRAAFDVNIGGTMNVLEAMLANRVRRLVFSSSASVYGEPEQEPMPEDHPIRCREYYGASKVAAEMMMRALHHRHHDEDARFDYVALRYMNVYGPRQYTTGAYLGVVATMLNALDGGRPPAIHGDGSQAYDFVHVSDCARANVLAMASGATDLCFNVGTGRKTSVLDLARVLCRLDGRDLQPAFTAANRPFVSSRVGDTRLAREQLQFSAAIGLEQGLQDTLAWHRGRAPAREDPRP